MNAITTIKTSPSQSQQESEWKYLFGVCGQIGEDFGFNPDLLRVGLGVGIIFAPVATLAGYFAVGTIVWPSRLLFPNRKRAGSVTVTSPARDETPVRHELPLAA